MSLVVRMKNVGGPEVLEVATADIAEPAPNEVRIRHTAIGVNFVDIYHRTGLYPVPSLPAVPGVEGAGVVDAIGKDVRGFRVGDRIAYAGLPVGSYSHMRNIPASQAISLPEIISDNTAAGMMLRGMTAHMLLQHVHRVQAGDVVLIHAAAGGLGLILTQWARHLGATVIGTVGNAQKAELAQAHGVDHAISYRDTDFVEEVRRLTGGRGVDVAYDGVGGTTLARTLACVRPFGTVASIGQTAGPIPPIDVGEIGPRRSLSLARPSVFAYMANRERYEAAAKALIGQVSAGLKVEIGSVFPLTDAAEAHRAMESGKTTGSVLLEP